MTNTDRLLNIRLGWVGVIAAILVGSGEFLLHYDTLARYEGSYEFMVDISIERMTLGHFLAVFGVPFYIAGCYHIYLMLKPANQRLAFIVFLVGSYGFVVGGVWIGSRANIGALVQVMPHVSEQQALIDLYKLRYENLLTVIRTTTLLISLIFSWLILSGKSHYPKWLAFIKPAFLIVLIFLLFKLIPEIGKFFMPIALNVAFLILFSASIWCARKI
jgi:hypothetical protein